MIGYILTQEQRDSIQGKVFASYKFFHCVQDKFDVWFVILTAEDKAEVLISEYAWVLNLPEGEYIAPDPFPPLEN
jgi:hypothetical protein